MLNGNIGRRWLEACQSAAPFKSGNRQQTCGQGLCEILVSLTSDDSEMLWFVFLQPSLNAPRGLDVCGSSVIPIPALVQCMSRLWFQCCGWFWIFSHVFLLSQTVFHSCAIEDCCNLRFFHAKFYTQPHLTFSTFLLKSPILLRCIQLLWL